jgi:hypothetical protein
MRRVLDDQRTHAAAATRRQWRWTELHTALIAEYGCCHGTAYRAIQRGVDHGYLLKSGRFYRAAPTRPNRGHPDPGRPAPRSLMPERLRILCLIAERDDWKSGELLCEIRRRFMVADSTARRNFRLSRLFGYVESGISGG